jgi:hypothetical protein
VRAMVAEFEVRGVFGTLTLLYLSGVQAHRLIF